ncbi:MULTISPECIES: hypothetical protein [Thermomonospora]|uniref:Uncharacterized protein n=1 Tax=Thermomonospora cellulosilytica TaxID=1411118 RepID=A0A7W3MUY3_9ACTN|nr:MULTISPECIES: hypothetical protein [Thermomonospora]MBA9002378.1 hypothetical protein [Thermomonospora cellulosilytica]
MRSVRLEGPIFNVSDDPDGVIGDFLGFALSLRNDSRRYLSAEELAELFSPEGDGMRLPDVFAAYRAVEPDDVPHEFGEQVAEEAGRKELWVLTRLRYGRAPDSAVVQGPELRHLLEAAFAQRNAALGL